MRSLDFARDDKGSMSSSILSSISVPGLEKLWETEKGKATAVAGVNQTLAAVIACLAAEKGKKTLLVMDNDLKAVDAAIREYYNMKGLKE